jgi:hypothetical protein
LPRHDPNSVDDDERQDYLHARLNREASKLYGSIKRGRKSLTADAPLLFDPNKTKHD